MTMSDSERDDLIVVKNLVKTYKLGEVKVHALRGADLTVKRGEFVAVLGPSGCGKTTLLQIIGGLAQPTSGKVVVEGIELSKAGDKRRTRFRRKKIGFVFQSFNLFNILSAADNIRLALQIRGNQNKTDTEETVHELMEMVGLGSKMNNKPLQLSQGEQQRVAIARALVGHPSILLADEPTGNLDSANGQRVLKLIRSLNETLGQTIMIITHNDEAAKFADRRIHMLDGQIIEQ